MKTLRRSSVSARQPPSKQSPAEDDGGGGAHPWPAAHFSLVLDDLDAHERQLLIAG
jgi:hypothetical protein